MKIRFKKLHEDAVIPFKGREADAGVDLIALTREIKVTDGGWYEEYNTFIAVEVPHNHVGLIFPRSSNSDVNQVLSNSVGVIDETYRGPLKLRFKPSNYDGVEELRHHNINERIGQLLIVPCVNIEPEESADLSTSNRGESGFGSSGK